MEEQKRLTDMVVDIVSSYVGNNSLAPAELPALISNVYKSVNGLTSTEPAKSEEPLQPAVSVKKSISNDFIICLEDGRKFKSLKRHLRTKYNMSPEDYRTKWGLPKDYPMVAPSYAQARSQLAKDMGLGQGGRKVIGSRKPRTTKA
jgi:predicted transcriptional regulator